MAENKRVETTGYLVIREGVERQFWPVLEAESLKEKQQN